MNELEKLRDAVRKHRDQRGDDRCWLDDEELYRVLPEGYVAPVRDTTVELKQCEKYIACRHNPSTTYVSPQRRIEQLEEFIAYVQVLVDDYTIVDDMLKDMLRKL